jgi:hypothetical protein
MTKQLLQRRKADASQARWMQAVIDELPDTDLAKQAALDQKRGCDEQSLEARNREIDSERTHRAESKVQTTNR